MPQKYERLFSIDRPGHRGKSTILQQCVTVRKVFCYSSNGNSVRASIVNGLNYVGADAVALKFLRGIYYAAKFLGYLSRL